MNSKPGDREGSGDRPPSLPRASLLRRGRRHLADHGVGSAFRTFLLRSGLYCFRRALIHEKRVGSGYPEPLPTGRSREAALPPLEFRIADLNDLGPGFQDPWFDAARAAGRISRGFTLILGRRGSRDVLHAWLETGRVDIPWLGIRGFSLKKGTGYLSCAYVPENERGHGTLLQALAFIETRLAPARGISRLFCVTAPDNPASNRTVEKAGFRPLTEIRFLRLSGLRLYLSRPAANPPHGSFSPHLLRPRFLVIYRA